MTELSLLEASEELRRRAYDLSRHQPMPIEILQDLVQTSDRLRNHALNLVGYQGELASILEQFSRLGKPTAAQPSPANNLEDWRHLALEFHGVKDSLTRGLLEPDFEPADLTRLLKRRDFTASIRGPPPATIFEKVVGARNPPSVLSFGGKLALEYAVRLPLVRVLRPSCLPAARMVVFPACEPNAKHTVCPFRGQAASH